MYKHNYRADIQIGNKIYKADKKTGIVLLPDVFPQFNPIDKKKPKIEPKEEVKTEKVTRFKKDKKDK